MLNIKNIQKNVTLAPYTTYKIGGPADYFVIVKNKQELVDAIREARKMAVPFFVLGLGANILVSDKGFRGLVIKNEAQNFRFEGTRLIAESGAKISDLIFESCVLGLSGPEHFAGIPSTVGGAMWQNLHFLSPDRNGTVYIENIVEGAEIINENGDVENVSKNYFQFDYDHSVLQKFPIFVTEVTFELVPKDKNIIDSQIKENLKWRKEKQPPVEEFPSCGSVFKKIAHVGAGRLIDECGLKGHKIGGAQVSTKHANFIVNTGKAKATDVLELIKYIQNVVKMKTGHKLETEINFVGEF